MLFGEAPKTGFTGKVQSGVHMIRLFAAIAAAVLVAASAVAHAQLSNSLGAQPYTEGQTLEDGTFIYEPILFQPAQIRAIVERAGLPIVAEEPVPEMNGHVIVASLYGLPLAYGFAECYAEGCAVMIQAHKAPTTVRGLRTTPQIVNQLNLEFPLGQLIADSNGDMVYRSGLPATPGCGVECMEVHMRIYLLSLNQLYSLLNDAVSRNSASLSSDLAVSAAITTLPALSSLVAQAGDIVGMTDLGNPAADFSGHELGAGELNQLLELSGLGDMASQLGLDDWSSLTGE